MNGLSADPGERTARVRSRNPPPDAIARISRDPASATSSASEARSGRSANCSAASRSTASCNGRSSVVATRTGPANAATACGACRGSFSRRVGTSGGSAMPCASRMRSRSTRARSAWRSGRSASGRRGIATSSAACAGSSMRGDTPNHASDPARTPSRLPPYGASVSQMPRISRLEKCASSCTARAISRHLLRTVRGRGCSSRAACMVSVDPPDTIRPARRSCSSARSSATGLTPGWCQNCRSSVATRSSSNAGETSSAVVEKRQTPPGAGSSATVRPCRSTISVPSARNRDNSGGKARSSAIAASASSSGAAASHRQQSRKLPAAPGIVTPRPEWCSNALAAFERRRYNAAWTRIRSS